MKELIIQSAPGIIAFLVALGGVIVAYGKFKAKALTKKEFDDQCDKNRDRCSKNIRDDIKELKGLVIGLHKEQTSRIEATNVEVSELKKAVGKIEGHMDAMYQARIMYRPK